MTLSLVSRPGRGSCFRILIPAEMECDTGAIATIPGVLDGPAMASGALSGRRILLIDDDPMVLQAMQALLAGWGIDLRCADQGNVDVLEVCGIDWVPECIISDFRLPGNRDGIELLDMLLEQYPTAIGILQTGELASSVQSRAQDEGYLVLSKPVEPALLAATLNALLERRRMPRTP